jgi:predicted Fe-Mo cluster-binding NifX family protein
MRICIPVSETDGRDWLVAPYLRHAEHLIFFDTETRSYDAIPLRELWAGANASRQADALLCTAIDHASLQSLIEQGVMVYGTEARTVAEAVARHQDCDSAPAVAKAGGCGSHGHAQAHAGGCCSGGQVRGKDGRPDGAGTHHCGAACGGQGHSAGHHGGASCAHPDSRQRFVKRKPRGDEFKIAVSSQNRKTVTEHAGKCRKFWIFDVRQGQVIGKTLLELPIEQSLHAAPAGAAHPLDSASVLITSGMGAGLQQRLLQRGVETVVTAEADPEHAVAAYLAGEIQAVPDAQKRC